MSLHDPAVRAERTERLAGLVTGRPVVLGPGPLAGLTPIVDWLASIGCPVLVLTTSRGAGPVPEPDSCEVVEIAVPATATVTEELRTLDRLTRSLPPDVVARVEAFDPGRQGFWWGSPFITDHPVLGRPVLTGRPQAFLALEDKLLAEEVWAAAGIDRAAYRIVAVDDDRALAAATAAVAGPLGAVWSGDARDGFNGGGDFVRWVRDDRDRAAAAAYFKPRCDRVRILPFLEGVPCSVHGFVMPDGTAALRPVEIAMLRAPTERRFVYGGLATWWDPPPADREHMRSVVRRVGEHLRERHGYRGGFGIDGVLTADGFRPTELNTRMSGGLSTVAEIDRWFFTLLQTGLVNGWDTGTTAAEVESLVTMMDEQRTGRAVAFGAGTTVPEVTVALDWDGTHFSISTDAADETAANLLMAGPTPTGWFANIKPCGALSRPGDRLATANLALMRLLDDEFGAGIGTLEIAPDVRQ